MSDVHRAPLVVAMRTFFRDVPAIMAAFSFAVVMTLVAAADGRYPDIQEGARLFFSTAGLLFHLASRHEITAARSALLQLPPVDPADLEAVDNMIRREYIRIAVKSIFIVATLAAMAIPPQETPSLEVARLVGAYALLVILVLLDLDAVLDRTSRRRQVQLIAENRETRLRVRLERERALEPSILAKNRALSEVGRDLAHQINNDLAVVVGAVDLLHGDGETDESEAEYLEAAALKLADATEHMKQLHDLVKSLAEVA
jgi:signal transduction histidine kinase